MRDAHVPAGPVTMARAETERGEVALRRHGEHLELIVNGAFAMDTVDVSTEVELARLALASVASPRRVLVGGLGLGFTAREVLADERVEHLDVVEIEEPLVQWSLERIVPELDLSEEQESGRVRLWPVDIAAVLAREAGPEGPWDLVLLDVDNGPGFLIHEDNERLYAADGLRAAADRVARGGVLVVWSADRAPELLVVLEKVAGATRSRASEVVYPVSREGRQFDYALYLLERNGRQ